MYFAEPEVDDDDSPLPEGEVVAAPLPSGRALGLRFASPYEPWLTLEGKRVVEDVDVDSRTVLVWMMRRLTPLYRALHVMRGLTGTLTATGTVVVRDVVNFDDKSALEHGALSSLLESSRTKTLDFSALGMSSTRQELHARVRGLFAAGTPLEVRVEDGQRVISRRRWRVGR
jgi:hypothetical protein